VASCSINRIRIAIGDLLMDKTFIEKMIRNCLYQYQHTIDSVPLSQRDYDELYERVMETYNREKLEINEIVQDVVYEYLTQ
jgi:urate oxidase